MNILSRYGVVYSFLFLGLVLSCEEPEPYFNHNAKPPEIKPLNFAQLTEGQHVTGTIFITFTPDVPQSNIQMVSLWVDEEMVYAYSGSLPYHFEVNTLPMSEGEHSLGIGVHLVNPPDLGLLSLAMVPPILYTIDVYVDHAPPTPVVLQLVEWDNNQKAPKLTWQKNTDANFYTYQVLREINGMFSYSELILNQETTSFIDSYFEDVVGIECKYTVLVNNRSQTVASNQLTFSYPERFPDTYDLSFGIIRPLYSPSTKELLILQPHGLKAYKLDNLTQVRSYPLDYKYAKAFALNQDGTRLYIVSTYSPKLLVLNVADFAIIASAETDFTGSNIVCGRPDRLYISTSWPGTLKVVDANTLVEIRELDIEAAGGLLAISPDNNTLYAADPNPNLYSKAKVYRITISTDDLEVLQMKQSSDQIRDLQLSEDGETLFVIHDNDYPDPLNKFVDCWNVSNLISYKTLPVPDQPFSLTAKGDDVYAIYGQRYENHFDIGGLHRYHYQNGELTGSWKFMQAPHFCVVPDGSDFMYTFGFHNWIVALN
ncbi:MAG: hypothetical protein KF846_17455 [Cyclobacteriaceae bacterium]|nr:hypothetical protein [Cyclobacteriaceae bacterium]